MALIEVQDLHRVFTVRPRRPGLWGAVRDLFGGEQHEVRALNGIDFAIQRGEVVGYIGPNGAGKSTTIKCLTGILRPTAGTVRVAGRDPWTDRTQHVRNIGVVFGQRTQLWWDLPVREAFDLLAAVFGVEPRDYQRRMDELNSLLDVRPLLHTPVRELSLGQRVRCDLAAALLHAPPVVLLDEPTIGLDIAVKLKVRAFIRELAQARDVAVLLTTHDLSDIQEVCDRVLLVDRGQVAFRGTLNDLRDQVGTHRVLVVDSAREISPEDLRALQESLPGEMIRRSQTSVELRWSGDPGAAAVIQAVMRHVEAVDLALREPSMEELVASLYQQSPPCG